MCRLRRSGGKQATKAMHKIRLDEIAYSISKNEQVITEDQCSDLKPNIFLRAQPDRII